MLLSSDCYRRFRNSGIGAEAETLFRDLYPVERDASGIITKEL